MAFRTFSASVASVSLLCACSSAPKSSEVTAEYVSAAQYNTQSCVQLINEAESLRRAIPAMESAVNQHRSNQTDVEVITWVLFWPAAFALDKGETHSNRLAKAKGELQAIQSVLLTKDCKGAGVVQATQPPQGGSTSSNEAEGKPGAVGAVASKLRELEDMRRNNLITDVEYKTKRQEILDRM